MNPFEYDKSFLDKSFTKRFATLNPPNPKIFMGGGDPVLNINDHATGGRRTKDILGGPKGWGPKKKVANVEIYVIFEVFAFCGGRTKTDFKDRGLRFPNTSQVVVP